MYVCVYVGLSSYLCTNTVHSQRTIIIGMAYPHTQIYAKTNVLQCGAISMLIINCFLAAHQFNPENASCCRAELNRTQRVHNAHIRRDDCRRNREHTLYSLYRRTTTIRFPFAAPDRVRVSDCHYTRTIMLHIVASIVYWMMTVARRKGECTKYRSNLFNSILLVIDQCTKASYRWRNSTQRTRARQATSAQSDDAEECTPSSIQRSARIGFVRHFVYCVVCCAGYDVRMCATMCDVAMLMVPLSVSVRTHR